MEDNILLSTKKMFGFDQEYIVFDHEIVSHLNSAFSTLDQLGIGPPGGFLIADGTEVWSALALPTNQLNAVKVYLFLKVRLAFDPPTTSYGIDALERQIKEHEVRLNISREEAIYGT